MTIEKLWRSLIDDGIPQHSVNAIELMYYKIKIKISDKTSNEDRIQTKPVSSILFNFYTSKVINKNGK